MISSAQLILGFVLLVLGAAWLVDGASTLARKLNVSDLVIGLTVVAFGTSAPEFFVNIYASATSNTEIAIGNILGSNAFNILLILGVSALIRPLSVGKGTVWKEIPLSLLAAVLVLVMANDKLIDKSYFDGLTRIDGIVLLTFFVVFLYYTFGIARQSTSPAPSVFVAPSRVSKAVFKVALGLVGLIVGARLVVAAAITLARAWGISEAVIGLTIVSVGTSLPELATSAVAAYKKNAEIAVGNIVGSNIFNIFLILGTSSVIRPLPFGQKYSIDALIVVLANVLLFIWMFTGKRRSLDRWEAAIFLLIYAAYITFTLTAR